MAYQTPLVDKNNLITPTWSKWLLQLYLRAGGADAPSNGSGLTNPMLNLGDMIYGTTSGVATNLVGNVAASKKFLNQTGSGATGGIPVWSAIVQGDLPNVMTTGGDMIYGGASGAPTRLGNGTIGQIFTSGGGTSAPSWTTNTSAAYLGSGVIGETTFTIANNQATPANVTGLFFDPVSIRSAEIDVQYYRNTTGAGATEMSARSKFLATYKTVAGSWDLAPLGSGGDFDVGTGEPAGITLSITAAGQVQYISTNFSGTAATSVMHFRASTMGV